MDRVEWSFATLLLFVGLVLVETVAVSVVMGPDAPERLVRYAEDRLAASLIVGAAVSGVALWLFFREEDVFEPPSEWPPKGPGGIRPPR